jgi:catechol 2,3-dioxygenase-like lactoylglutathione lyase family enzyme
MLDHFSLSVKDFDQSLKFYDQTLAVLGCDRLMSFDIPEGKFAGYGKDAKPSFWISDKGQEEEDIGRARGVHCAFLAPNMKAVQDWYDKCLALGGQDNGAPGVRPEYHPGYYGAFVIDPNGWRIEACFHGYHPEG